MDFATHASGTALYMVRNKESYRSGEYSDIPVDFVESNNLYTNKSAMFFESWFDGGPLEATLGEIDYDRFSEDAVVEFHGCRVGVDVNTASIPLLADNLAENFSEGLFAAGNEDSVVIAHVTKANPSINGEWTLIQDQDYRHGSRVIFHNGSILFSTKKKGHIGKDVILNYLRKKESNQGRYDGEKEIF